MVALPLGVQQVLIWLPLDLYLLLTDGFVSYPWAVVLAINVVGMAVVDSLIRSVINVEAQNPDVISLSVLMGLLTFGPYGAIIGPILSGVTLVLLDIYKTEVHRRHTAAAAAAGNPVEQVLAGVLRRSGEEAQA